VTDAKGGEDVGAMREALEPLVGDAPLGSKFNLDLEDKSTPPLLKVLAHAVRESPPWALLEEARRQFVEAEGSREEFLYGFPHPERLGFGPVIGWKSINLHGSARGWEEAWEKITKVMPLVERAKQRLTAMAVGIALGVTHPNVKPELVALVEAINLDRDVKRGMMRKEAQKRQAERDIRKWGEVKARQRRAERRARKKQRRRP